MSEKANLNLSEITSSSQSEFRYVELLLQSSAYPSATSAVVDTRIIGGEFVVRVSRFLGRRIAYHLARTHACYDSSNMFSGDSCKSGHVPKPTETLVSSMQSITFRMLQIMGSRMRIRESELLQGLILLERFLARSAGGFTLKPDTFPMALTVCVMLANKMSADSVFTNRSWCEVFGIRMEHFSSSEKYVLSVLQYNLNVDGDALLRLIRAIQAEHS